MRTCALFLLGAWMCCVACTSEQNSKVNINVVRADSLLNQVLALYEVKEYGLLLENYPPKENERATYLADETQQAADQKGFYIIHITFLPQCTLRDRPRVWEAPAGWRWGRAVRPCRKTVFFSVFPRSAAPEGSRTG